MLKRSTVIRGLWSLYGKLSRETLSSFAHADSSPFFRRVPPRSPSVLTLPRLQCNRQATNRASQQTVWLLVGNGQTCCRSGFTSDEFTRSLRICHFQGAKHFRGLDLYGLGVSFEQPFIQSNHPSCVLGCFSCCAPSRQMLWSYLLIYIPEQSSACSAPRRASSPLQDDIPISQIDVTLACGS